MRKNPPVLKSVAIHQLRTLAVELKKTPTVVDIIAAARQKKCPPMHTIIKLFGCASVALKAAKLPPQRNQEFTEEQLIAQLQDLSRALGRHVNRRDIKKAGKAGACARLVTFRRVFGNTETALRKAGVGRVGRYTKDELIDQYRALYKELGRLPTYQDIYRAARKGRCAGYKVFRARCGTLEQLREAAGLVRVRRKYTREQVLDQLKKLAAKLGRTPLAKDLIYGRHQCATIETIRRYFGTYNKALTAAGLMIRPRSYSRAQLIQMLQDLAKRLGHRPTVREVNEAKLRGECASAPTYDDWFGNLSTAIREAGLASMPERKVPRKPYKHHKRYTREQMQKQLERLTVKLGHIPKQQDVVAANHEGKSAGLTALKSEFGTFRAALRSVGLEVPERPRGYTHDQLIGQLRQLASELNRIPTTHDIDEAKACASTKTFIQRFGSLMDARKAAKLDQVIQTDSSNGRPSHAREMYERDALIMRLRSLAERIGKAPSKTDIETACKRDGMPGVKAYQRVFGGIPAARKAAKLDEVFRRT